MNIPSSMLFLPTIVLAALLHAGTAAADPAEKRAHHEGQGIVSLGGGYLYGNTTYRIDAADPVSGQAVISELKFPIQTPLINVELGYADRDRRDRDTLEMRLRYAATAGKGTGTLKDSDWLNAAADIATVGSAHGGKDIYSESSIELDARIADLTLSYTAWQGGGFGLGLLGGYLYEQFNYSADNTVQAGFGPYAPYSGSTAGRTLKYEVTYNIPYLGVRTRMGSGAGFHAVLDLGYSPWAKADDRDDHVLRTKLATCDASGWAYIAALNAGFPVEDDGLIELRAQYLKIDANGTQTQQWYGNGDPSVPAGTVISGISDQITSQQYSALLLFTVRF